MIKTKELILLLCVVVLAGCGTRQERTGYEAVAKHEPEVRHMPEYGLTDSTEAYGHKYVYEINRTASETLPMVKDDMEDWFADNEIRLQIWRDGREMFDEVFTKEVFRDGLDNNFYQQSILDGIRFVRVEKGQGMVFSMSISYPESDMSVPFLLTITDAGGFSFVKDDNLDMEGEDDGV